MLLYSGWSESLFHGRDEKEEGNDPLGFLDVWSVYPAHVFLHLSAELQCPLHWLAWLAEETGQQVLLKDIDIIY